MTAEIQYPILFINSSQKNYPTNALLLKNMNIETWDWTCYSYLQVSEDDMTEASEKRSAGVMAMNDGTVNWFWFEHECGDVFREEDIRPMVQGWLFERLFER